MSNIITFSKVKDLYGWLDNMSPYPVTYQDVVYRTTEHLFQCLRFTDSVVIANIIGKKSPMLAKFTAKKNRDKYVVAPMSEQDIKNMEICVGLKLDQHPEIAKMLLDTGDALLIEDVTNRVKNINDSKSRDLFWGAALKNGTWVGENHLGRIWMLRRKRLADRSTLVASLNGG